MPRRSTLISLVTIRDTDDVQHTGGVSLYLYDSVYIAQQLSSSAVYGFTLVYDARTDGVLNASLYSQPDPRG